MELNLEMDISKILREISNEKKNTKKKYEKSNINFNTLDLSDNKDIDNLLVNFKCIECNCYKIKEIEGFYVCLKCGLKIESIIDAGQEWRNYNNDDSRGIDQSRCDMPTNELLPKSSMGSLIGWGGQESFTTKRIRNMSRWYSTTYKESSLIEIFNNITIIAINSGLNQCIIEEAKYIFIRVCEIKKTHRSKKDDMKAGAIALACKIHGCPRNSDEIANICHLKNNKTLRRRIKSFEEIWNNIILKEKEEDKELVNKKKILQQQKEYLKSYEDVDADANKCIIEKVKCDIDDIDDIDNIDDIGKSINNFNSNQNIISKYISKLHRLISILGLDDKVFQASKKILDHIETHNYLEKHNPQSQLAFILFYVIDRLNIKINKSQIVQVCQVSQATIDKCYQKLIKYKAALNQIDIN